MTGKTTPAAILAADAPSRTKPSNYPEPLFSRKAGRQKRPLGDVFGLKTFGVVDGAPTLVTESGETILAPGMCAGFPAGGEAHQLVNNTDRDAIYLEVGDRTPGDEARYPRDDPKAVMGVNGQ